MKLVEGTFIFDFSAVVIEAFPLDHGNDPHFYGLAHCGMKTVDIIAEFPNETLFIEVKDFARDPDPNAEKLKHSLAQKYRDTWLSQYCEKGITKPIKYVCILENLDSRLFSQLAKQLAQYIPTKHPRRKWISYLLNEKDLLVIDKKQWNEHLSYYGRLL